MAGKLREMEEQVRIMKEKLNKKRSDTESSTPGKSERGNGSSSSPSQGSETPKSAKKQKTIVTEVDMFSPTSMQQVVANKKLLSPVKTNPLSEAEKAPRPALYVAKSTEWCPSLLKSSTSRVLTGEEGEQVRKNIGFIDREREMAEIARNDLADSDDEDLTEFGKMVSKRIAHSGDTSGVQRN